MRIFQSVIPHRPLLFYSTPLFDFQKSQHTQVWSVKSQGNSIIPSLSIESQSKKSSQHITKGLFRMSLYVSSFCNKFWISPFKDQNISLIFSSGQENSNFYNSFFQCSELYIIIPQSQKLFQFVSNSIIWRESNFYYCFDG